MKLSVKHVRTNEYNHYEEEVPQGTPYSFWRVVEHTGAGWFPWEGIYTKRSVAVARMEKALAQHEGKGDMPCIRCHEPDESACDDAGCGDYLAVDHDPT